MQRLRSRDCRIPNRRQACRWAKRALVAYPPYDSRALRAREDEDAGGRFLEPARPGLATRFLMTRRSTRQPWTSRSRRSLVKPRTWRIRERRSTFATSKATGPKARCAGSLQRTWPSWRTRLRGCARTSSWASSSGTRHRCSGSRPRALRAAAAICSAKFSYDESNEPQLALHVDYKTFTRERTDHLSEEHLRACVREEPGKKKKRSLLLDAEIVARALKHVGPWELKFYWFNRGRIMRTTPELWNDSIRDFLWRSGRWGSWSYRDGACITSFRLHCLYNEMMTVAAARRLKNGSVCLSASACLPKRPIWRV